MRFFKTACEGDGKILLEMRGKLQMGGGGGGRAVRGWFCNWEMGNC